LAYLRAKCVQKKMQRGMGKQVRKFVFFLGTVLLKQMERLYKVFYVCFLRHHGLGALILQKVKF